MQRCAPVPGDGHGMLATLCPRRLSSRSTAGPAPAASYTAARLVGTPVPNSPCSAASGGRRGSGGSEEGGGSGCRTGTCACSHKNVQARPLSATCHAPFYSSLKMRWHNRTCGPNKVLLSTWPFLRTPENQPILTCTARRKSLITPGRQAKRCGSRTLLPSKGSAAACSAAAWAAAPRPADAAPFLPLRCCWKKL